MTKRTLVQLYVSLALVFIPSTWNSAEGTGCSHRPARGEYYSPSHPLPASWKSVCNKIVHVQIICCLYSMYVCVQHAPIQQATSGLCVKALYNCQGRRREKLESCSEGALEKWVDAFSGFTVGFCIHVNEERVTCCQLELGK